MFISLLNVTAVAEDAPPGTVVVTIKVCTPPSRLLSYIYSTGEELSLSNFCFQALDQDVSTNAEIQYQIVSGNINNTFHLNKSRYS
jgi:hypothetical protein